MIGYRAYLHYADGGYESCLIEADSFAEAMMAAEVKAAGRALKTVELTLTLRPVTGQAA